MKRKKPKRDRPAIKFPTSELSNTKTIGIMEKNKERRYRQKWFENRSMIYAGRYEPILQKKRSLEYKSKLKAYSVFLKEDLEHFHYSIVQMLRFKISRNLLRLSGRRIRLDFDSKNLKLMKNVVELLEEVEKSDFGENAALKKLTMKWRPIRKRYSDRLPPALLKKSNSEHNRVATNCQNKRKAALAKAFSIITENMWDWWDEEYAGDQTALTGKVEFVPKRKIVKK